MLTIYDVDRRRRAPIPWTPAVAFLVCGAACGPSFQTVYEGDVRFEHCYALDETGAPPETKKDCWRRWLRGYTNGQSWDRVEYAATRFSQLSLGPTLPSEESRDARPGRRAPTVAAPVPTNAFAPPPNVASSTPVTASAAPSVLFREGSARAPRSDCCDGCAEHWSTCRGSCQGAACDACDASYRACMPACFREEAPLQSVVPAAASSKASAPASASAPAPSRGSK
jgi:hypothetical protein